MDIDGFAIIKDFERDFAMLVLSRYIGESVIINGNIEIKVVERKGSKIILGITAPQDVIVHRKEIQDKIYKDIT